MVEVTKTANEFRLKWQKMVRAFLRLESDWADLSRTQRKMSELDFDSLPVEVQILARQSFLSSPFNFGIEGLIRLGLQSDGFESLLIPKTILAQKTQSKPAPKPKPKIDAKATLTKSKKALEDLVNESKEDPPPNGKAALEAMMNKNKKE